MYFCIEPDWLIYLLSLITFAQPASEHTLLMTASNIQKHNIVLLYQRANCYQAMFNNKKGGRASIVSTLVLCETVFRSNIYVVKKKRSHTTDRINDHVYCCNMLASLDKTLCKQQLIWTSKATVFGVDLGRYLLTHCFSVHTSSVSCQHFSFFMIGRNFI